MKNRDLRISRSSRMGMKYDKPIFQTSDIEGMYRQAQELTKQYNDCHERHLSSARIYICACLHLIYQTVISSFLRGSDSEPFSRISVLSDRNKETNYVLRYYDCMFPTLLTDERFLHTDETARAFFVHQILQANPALISATGDMLDQSSMDFPQGTKALTAMMGSYMRGTAFCESVQSSEDDLYSFLTLPARLFPDSLTKQINYILEHWDMILAPELCQLLLKSRDYLTEEKHLYFPGGPGPMEVPNYSGENDPELFSQDSNWMPNVVMLAKSTLVWLDQLSKKYNREIDTLDKIPDRELDELRDRGFTALWLIGLWERSKASRTIKQLCGNQDADSSAYSLKNYTISGRIGGWDALNNLKSRLWQRGIRIASDMVPNHTGIDSDWVVNHSSYFMQQSYPPYPSYTYNGPDLSSDPDVEIKLEDHYYNRTDAAVTFRRYDRRTGETSYIFHGNDGTSMPWNDTAQIDFMNSEAREAVIQQIIDVARNFPVIRFDAAMTLAKRHIQRLWYPKPGNGGDIAGRVPYEMSDEEFNRRIPNEFWREVVDRISSELPDTLLLAEAFWMMESYFVRTLGMHRVYNSAFMHMLKNEDNEKFRDSIKATLAFDPEILKRYVNFMNNPDEETAIAQFGDGDKYFGVCTLLATMPGLPMFGHGQIEGYREKYGMEYQRAYLDETPSRKLVLEHERKIFPLLKMRPIFSDSRYFQMFDVKSENGEVQQSVYAFVNGNDQQMALVLYNNRFERVHGHFNESVPKLVKNSDGSREMKTVSIAEALDLTRGVRRYVIYKDFSDNLTYLVPSIRLFEEGLPVNLNGYQTKVYININEMEDIDGVYARLYDKLQGQGVNDIDYEIRMLYLQPFFEAAEPVAGPKFAKDLRSLLRGNANQVNKRNLMQALGNTYTYMEELGSVFEKIGLHLHSMKPQKVLENINRLEHTCARKTIENANRIIEDDLTSALAASFLIMPFITEDCTLDNAMKVARKLHLTKLFNMQEAVILRCAIIVSREPKDMEVLLENRSFLDLIGANEYKGTRWYRGESFQECMYLVYFSKALFSEKVKLETLTSQEAQQYKEGIYKWLKKSADAEYKLDNLMSREHGE